MLHYFLDYGCFLLGSALYVLGKCAEYKKLAKQHPDQSVNFNLNDFFNEEWINLTRFYIGGVALIIFMPMLIGDGFVELKGADGAVLLSLELKEALMPFYFLTAYGGNSALFAVFGKYKTTFMNKVGVEDNP